MIDAALKSPSHLDVDTLSQLLRARKRHTRAQGATCSGWAERAPVACEYAADKPEAARPEGAVRVCTHSCRTSAWSTITSIGASARPTTDRPRPVRPRTTPWSSRGRRLRLAEKPFMHPGDPVRRPSPEHTGTIPNLIDRRGDTEPVARPVERSPRLELPVDVRRGDRGLPGRPSERDGRVDLSASGSAAGCLEARRAQPAANDAPSRDRQTGLGPTKRYPCDFNSFANASACGVDVGRSPSDRGARLRVIS